MIVTCAGFKGGVGKTTTAVHLACFFSSLGNTVLVDGDPNHSATGWSARGDLPFKVVDIYAAAKATTGKDWVVLDTQARPNAGELEAIASGCDLLILPTSPDALSVDALLATVDLLKDLPCQYRVLLTQVDSRSRGTANQVRKSLEKVGLPLFKQSIRELKCYEKAALEGIPVYEVKDKMSQIAWREYQAVGEEILNV